MCLFLSPKFIEFLRNREFGQNIREEGPQGHQTKAGTPTMGGIIIFLAIAVPYVLLSKRDWQLAGCVLRRDRLRAAGLRRRLHQDRQAPVAGPARADQAGGHDRHLRWACGGSRRRRPTSGRPSSCGSSTPRSTSGPCSRCSSTWWWPGRPPRSTSPTAWTAWPPGAPPSSCSPTSGSRSSPARAICRCWPAAWWGRASASCGSTASPPASSWATPVRWAWAAPSPAWRS